jgi:hypothetical protein
MELLRRNLPKILLVGGAFILGYNLRYIGYSNELKAKDAQMSEQHRLMDAQCDAKLVINQKMMDEQTDRIKEQTGYLSEQTELIEQLKLEIDNIQLTQHQSIHLRQVELTAVNKATQAAQNAVKGVTEKDKQQINAVVKESKGK